jgi:hypothetical protein
MMHKEEWWDSMDSYLAGKQKVMSERERERE